MTITSNEPLVLDELFNDLKREHIETTKETKDVEGGMLIDGVTIALILAGGTLTFKAIDTLINILNFYENKKKLELERLKSEKTFYIHIKLKDGREMNLNELSQEKQKQEYNAVKGKLEILTIDMGEKK